MRLYGSYVTKSDIIEKSHVFLSLIVASVLKLSELSSEAAAGNVLAMFKKSQCAITNVALVLYSIRLMLEGLIQLSH